MKYIADIAVLLCLTLLLPDIALAQFTGDFWSDFPGGAKAVCDNDDTDIDEDNDGLIELCYLEDVNAIRNNNRGTSLIRDSKTFSNGCPSSGCNGYELVRDLDFKDDDSYSSPTNIVKWTVDDYEDSDDNGWQPIGNYNALFEGNAHTISNLMINRPGTNNVGLFGNTDSSSKIANISLLNVRINGNRSVGGLIGFVRKNSIVMNSYASGSVEAGDNAGGLVGLSLGSITNSYASGAVKGEFAAGGLVGYIQESTVADSYATASVNGDQEVGGLAGANEGGTIANSYASGAVAGNSDVGGLFGYSDGNIANSYWDTEASGISTSAGGTSKTTAELQTPTERGSTPTEIYYGWSADNWDFGTGNQYPALKYAQDCGTPQQPACGTLLPGQRNNPPTITPISDIILLEATSKTLVVTVTDADGDPISVRLDSSDSTVATATIVATSGANRTLKITALDKGMAAITVLVDDGRGEANSTAAVTFMVTVKANEAPVIMSVMPAKSNYDEGDSVSVTTNASDANHDDLTYTWSVTSKDKNPRTLTEATKINDGRLSFDVPADWVINPSTATGVTETLQLQVTVRDGNMSVTRTAEVVITKIDNDTVKQPSISVDKDDVNLFTFNEIVLMDDPDGVNDNPNLNYQWQRCLANADCSPQGDWQDIGRLITDAANRSLTVPNDLRTVGNKFRVKITYTDGQGYRDNIFSSARDYTTNPAVRVRIKVFLEGPLQ